MSPEELIDVVRGVDAIVFTAGSNGGSREATREYYFAVKKEADINAQPERSGLVGPAILVADR